MVNEMQQIVRWEAARGNTQLEAGPQTLGLAVLVEEVALPSLPWFHGRCPSMWVHKWIFWRIWPWLLVREEQTSVLCLADGSLQLPLPAAGESEP